MLNVPAMVEQELWGEGVYISENHGVSISSCCCGNLSLTSLLPEDNTNSLSRRCVFPSWNPGSGLNVPLMADFLLMPRGVCACLSFPASVVGS